MHGVDQATASSGRRRVVHEYGVGVAPSRTYPVTHCGVVVGDDEAGVETRIAVSSMRISAIRVGSCALFFRIVELLVAFERSLVLPEYFQQPPCWQVNLWIASRFLQSGQANGFDGDVLWSGSRSAGRLRCIMRVSQPPNQKRPPDHVVHDRSPYLTTKASPFLGVEKEPLTPWVVCNIYFSLIVVSPCGPHLQAKAAEFLCYLPFTYRNLIVYVSSIWIGLPVVLSQLATLAFSTPSGSTVFSPVSLNGARIDGCFSVTTPCT